MKVKKSKAAATAEQRKTRDIIIDVLNSGAFTLEFQEDEKLVARVAAIEKKLAIMPTTTRVNAMDLAKGGK